jgi:hypothetical protein
MKGSRSPVAIGPVIRGPVVRGYESALRIQSRHFDIQSSAFDIRNWVPLRSRIFVPPSLRTPFALEAF